MNKENSVCNLIHLRKLNGNSKGTSLKSNKKSNKKSNEKTYFSLYGIVCDEFFRTKTN